MGRSRGLSRRWRGVRIDYDGCLVPRHSRSADRTDQDIFSFLEFLLARDSSSDSCRGKGPSPEDLDSGWVRLDLRGAGRRAARAQS